MISSLTLWINITDWHIEKTINKLFKRRLSFSFLKSEKDQTSDIEKFQFSTHLIEFSWHDRCMYIHMFTFSNQVIWSLNSSHLKRFFPPSCVIYSEKKRRVNSILTLLHTHIYMNIHLFSSKVWTMLVTVLFVRLSMTWWNCFIFS